MSDLRLTLDDTTFEDLVELGRSIIPSAAPEWTDHNVHDPGIMLLELLAWTADAQIYALGRMRRDERLAYARLLGVRPRGPRPARGLVWPCARPLQDGLVVARTTPIVANQPDAPEFHTTHDIHLTRAEVKSVSSRFADGRVVDWTTVNTQDGATFMPFGSAPTAGDRLVLAFEGTLLPDTKDALVAIGIEIVPRDVSRAPAPANREHDDAGHGARRLRVAMEDAAGERPVTLAHDTTRGLLRSGVLLVSFSESARPIADRFAITIRSATGTFLVTPRVRRIAVNVLPVQQMEDVEEFDPDFCQGLPDRVYRLRRTGFVFAEARRHICVTTIEGSQPKKWRPADDLQQHGPADRRFVLDPEAGTLSFGNGVNGMMPPAGATLRVTYRVSAGARGNLADGLAWTVRGLPAPVGRSSEPRNSEPMSGGTDARTLDDLRSIARERVADARPCVTTDDLVKRALSFTDLGVMRAHEATSMTTAQRGVRTLVVVGPHEDDAGSTEESRDWLEEIRSRLSRCLPLGQRLVVVAPRYVDVRVVARLLARPNTDPLAVREDATEELRKRLAIVAPDPADDWPIGRDLTGLTVKGWLRRVEGVAQVDVTLLRNGRADAKDVRIPDDGLPRLTVETNDITIERWPGGATS